MVNEILEKEKRSMKKTNKYLCIAKFIKIIENEGESYLVKFPDLAGCLAEGKTLVIAMERAVEACSNHMLLLEEIPKPNISLLSSQANNEKEFYTLLSVDLYEHEKRVSQKAVKKNVSLPSWLNERAEEEGINFSQVLQKGLKHELKIS